MHQGSPTMTLRKAADRFSRYTVVPEGGSRLSPAEDLATAVIAAAQSTAFGQSVLRINRGEAVILEGGSVKEALAKSA
jgi:hypothetical protein